MIDALENQQGKTRKQQQHILEQIGIDAYFLLAANGRQMEGGLRGLDRDPWKTPWQ